MISASAARKLASKHDQVAHKTYESFCKELTWHAEAGFSNGAFNAKGDFIVKVLKDSVKKKYRTFISVDGIQIQVKDAIEDGVCPGCVYLIELEW